MPTKRAILAGLTRAELRVNVDNYELAVDDRRVMAQLENALARSRKTRIDEILSDDALLLRLKSGSEQARRHKGNIVHTAGVRTDWHGRVPEPPDSESRNC